MGSARETEAYGYVVVTFGGEAPDWCDLNHCPMGARWFATRGEADAYRDALPEWTRPHLLLCERESAGSEPVEDGGDAGDGEAGEAEQPTYPQGGH
jgi:hypothetical protein